MIAIQIKQKDAAFYVASYPAEELLSKVRFTCRVHAEDRLTLKPKSAKAEDEVAEFITKIEKTEKAFQRNISRSKVQSIRKFYQASLSQPPIPGAVMLFTPKKLQFNALNGDPNVGKLQSPDEKFLIIDGQHRLAALNFYKRTNPNEVKSINVPVIIFDGSSDEFATEMYVIINSTLQRINKSHLVDLYEQVSWSEPDRRFASHIVELLYNQTDSPLRYRINRLGGRSKEEKWILQAELFDEVHRWVKGAWKKIQEQGASSQRAEQYYRMIRDFLKASSEVFEDMWANDNFMITKPVTLKALIRVCADLSAVDAEPEQGRVARWRTRLSPWAGRGHEFRKHGFFKRLAANGQRAAVAKIHRQLAHEAGLD